MDHIDIFTEVEIVAQVQALTMQLDLNIEELSKIEEEY